MTAVRVHSCGAVVRHQEDGSNRQQRGDHPRGDERHAQAADREARPGGVRHLVPARQTHQRRVREAEHDVRYSGRLLHVTERLADEGEVDDRRQRHRDDGGERDEVEEARREDHQVDAVDLLPHDADDVKDVARETDDEDRRDHRHRHAHVPERQLPAMSSSANDIIINYVIRLLVQRMTSS